MQYFFIENKTSDRQEEANLICHSSIFTNGEVYNRQKHQLLCTHGWPRTASFISNQRSNPLSVVERDYL